MALPQNRKYKSGIFRTEKRAAYFPFPQLPLCTFWYRQKAALAQKQFANCGGRKAAYAKLQTPFLKKTLTVVAFYMILHNTFRLKCRFKVKMAVTEYILQVRTSLKCKAWSISPKWCFLQCRGKARFLRRLPYMFRRPQLFLQ